RVTATMIAPATNAKTTEATGMASPRVSRATPGRRRRGRAAIAPVPIDCLGGDVSRWRHRAGLDRGLNPVELGLDVSRQLKVVQLVAGALVGDAEGQSTALELVVDDVLDRRVGRDVDLFQRARDDGR